MFNVEQTNLAKLKLTIDPKDICFSVNYVKSYFVNSLKSEQKVLNMLKSIELKKWDKNIFHKSMELMNKIIELEILKKKLYCNLLEKYIAKFDVIQSKFKSYIQSRNFRALLRILQNFNTYLDQAEKVMKSKKIIDSIKSDSNSRHGHEHIERAKHILISMEDIRKTITQDEITFIEDESANFNKFSNTLARIIKRYFESALQIRVQITKEMNDILKEYQKHDGSGLDYDTFRILKAVVTQINFPEEENLENESGTCYDLDIGGPSVQAPGDYDFFSTQMDIGATINKPLSSNLWDNNPAIDDFGTVGYVQNIDIQTQTRRLYDPIMVVDSLKSTPLKISPKKVHNDGGVFNDLGHTDLSDFEIDGD